MQRSTGIALLALATAGLGIPATGSQSESVRGTVEFNRRPASGAVVVLEGDPSSSPSMSGVTIDTVVMDQVGLEFTPAVLAVAPGSIVEFRNSDSVLHNIFSPGRTGTPFDLGTYGSDATRYQSFADSGAHVILCNIHPEMLAHVFVTSSRHVGITDETGRFEIVDVPPGSYRLTVWHPWARAHEQDVELERSLNLKIRLRSR